MDVGVIWCTSPKTRLKKIYFHSFLNLKFKTLNKIKTKQIFVFIGRLNTLPSESLITFPACNNINVLAIHRVSIKFPKYTCICRRTSSWHGNLYLSSSHSASHVQNWRPILNLIVPLEANLIWVWICSNLLLQFVYETLCFLRHEWLFPYLIEVGIIFFFLWLYYIYYFIFSLQNIFLYKIH